MHSYSLDTEVRRLTYVAIAAVALGIPAAFESVRTLLGLPPNIGFPITFGAMYGLLQIGFDRWGWKLRIGKWWPLRLLGVPNLNGDWLATGTSSYVHPETGEAHEYQMDVRIRQTFSKMEIFTNNPNKDGSTSRSTMAALCTQHAVGSFRYAFENTPRNMANPELQRHSGLVELRVEDENHMSGDYFSGKFRLRFGELRLERKQS